MSEEKKSEIENASEEKKNELENNQIPYLYYRNDSPILVGLLKVIGVVTTIIGIGMLLYYLMSLFIRIKKF